MNFFALMITLLSISQIASAQDFSGEPDATINSSSLSDLPKDVIAAPFLKDLLNEDFIFYYQEGGQDALSFKGTLARIAYERKVDWPTKLVSWIFRGPAEIALWKGRDGKLNHFMLVVDQTGIKEVAKLLATVAAEDSQIAIVESEGKQVIKVTLSNTKSLFLSSHENRLFVYSDLNMKHPDQINSRSIMEKTKAFFGLNEDVSIYGPKLQKARHLISLSAHYLSFGYQSFFPSIRALRFEFLAKKGWAAKVLSTQKFSEGDSKNWSSMAKGAAFCLNVPVDLQKITTVIKAEGWINRTSGSAIACWYPDSKLYTPVIAVRGDFKELLRDPKDLRALFTNSIGARETIWVKAPGTSTDEVQERTLKFLPMLPVQEVKSNNAQIAYVREVGARFGIHPSTNSLNKKLLGSHRYFKVKLAATNDALVFSPDDKLVDKVLSTLEGKFPSMLSSLSAKSRKASLIISPDEISKLAKSSILESLPESQESLFRTAISRHLFPNLDKFSKTPLHAATLQGSDLWKDVDWSPSENR